jgi:serine/threonine protein phosphatase PrpC
MIRTAHSSFPVSALTHPGMSGKNNEDRFAVSAYRLNRRKRVPVLLAVLSDGIGGHRAGEVAAEIAVERISQAVAASDGDNPVETLRQSIQQASLEVYALATSDPNRQGMGATCGCAWILGRQLYAATVGDSRVYLMRKDSISQLNTDHTWVQEALEQGILKQEHIKGHPNQHVIRRYIGSPNPPEVDFRLRLPAGDLSTRSEENQGMLLVEGDRVLLCSDGLTDLVEDREILAAYEQYSLEHAGQYLVNLANSRGGHDNITLVVIEIPRRTLFERISTSNRVFFAAALVAVLLTVVIFVGILIGFDRLNNPGEGDLPTVPVITLQPTQALPVMLPSEAPTALATLFQPGQPTLLPTFTITPPATTTPRPTLGGNTPTPWPTNTVNPYP